jgi:hypothetical protein
MFTVTAFSPSLAPGKPRKSTAAATMLHALRDHRRTQRQPNPVETAGKIAFAYGINHSPKSPLRDQPGTFQTTGYSRRTEQLGRKANDGEVERRKVG